jgi:hypothetical protein
LALTAIPGLSTVPASRTGWRRRDHPEVTPKGYRPRNSQAKELHHRLALWREGRAFFSPAASPKEGRLPTTISQAKGQRGLREAWCLPGRASDRPAPARQPPPAPVCHPDLTLHDA